MKQLAGALRTTLRCLPSFFAYVTQKQRPNRHKLVFSDISTKGENLIVKVREVDGSIRNPTKRELVRAVQMENPWQGNRAHTYAPNYF